MRLLADENFLGDAVDMLRAIGHDVTWIRTYHPGIADMEVLAIAQREGRIVLTFDKDFGELAYRYRLSAGSGVILFRISTPSPEAAARLVCAAIDGRRDWEGHFSVVEDFRIRMTALP